MIFKYETTHKNIIQYIDDQKSFYITDCQGNEVLIEDKFGIAILPTTYILGRSEEYCEFLDDNYSERAKYNEK